jgi:hypothetical protein
VHFVVVWLMSITEEAILFAIRGALVQLQQPGASAAYFFGRWLWVLLLPIRPIVSTESSAQYLTGSAREDFIKGTASGCMQAKINEPNLQVLHHVLRLS